MKIFLCPMPEKDDDYLGKLKIYIDNGSNEFVGIEDLSKNLFQLFRINAASFNFVENIASSNEKKAKVYLSAIKYISFMLFLKITGTKIYFTLNNKLPHDCRYDRIGYFMIKMQILLSNTTILLCKNSKDIVEEYVGKRIAKRRCYYVGAPLVEHSKGTDKNQISSPENRNTRFVFFGNIKRYKNIDLLIDSWKELRLENAELVIAGRMESDKYKQLLNRKAENTENLRIIEGYLSNHKLDALIQSATVIVEPFDLKSGINSATLLRAASMKKTMIISEIPLLYDFGKDLFFSYVYNNREEHLEKLKDRMRYVYNLAQNRPEVIIEMGEKLYKRVHEAVSESQVKKRYVSLF